MDTKLFARIGAIVFVAIAITVTVLQLREERKPEHIEVVNVDEPDGDPLPEMLRLCSELGQVAETTNECRQAWAEKRRRFLGADRAARTQNEAGQAKIDPAPSVPASSEAGGQ